MLFDEQGKVTGAKNPNCQGNDWGLRPIPDKPELLQDAWKAKRMLDSVMQPSSKDGITTAITKLALHCGMQGKAEDQVKSMHVIF